MIVGRHPDGRIYLMALEFLIPAMVRSSAGKWHRQNLSAEELNDFAVIRDQKIVKGFVIEILQLMLNDECICPSECDCANPDGEGVASVSNACPEHNLYPLPVQGCESEKHNGGQGETK